MSLLSFNGLKNLQISYNFLNLPSVVTQDDIPVAEYSWFADGRKYRVLTQQNNGYIYTGSLIYASNNGNLQIESTDFTGGRINLAENTGTNTLSQDIQYHHKDHLVPIALKRYHCSVVSGTNVALRAVPLVAL